MYVLYSFHGEGSSDGRLSVKSVWIVYVALLLAPAVGLGNSVGPSIYQQADAFVVCISTSPRRGVGQIGSGFFVAPNYVATAAHLVKDAEALLVYLSDGSKQRVGNSEVSVSGTVALMHLTRTNADYLKLAPNTPGMGDEVFTIGCPYGLAHSLSRGVVSNPERRMEDKSFIQTDLQISPGNSGGPLLDINGKVAGVIYGFFKASDRINFSTPIAAVRELLERKRAYPDLLTTPDVSALWLSAQSAQEPQTRVSLYQKIVRRNPTLAEAHYNLANAHFELGDYPSAQRALEKAVAVRPTYYQAYTNLGLTLHKLGRYREARDMLMKAIAINAEFAPAYLNLGVVFQEGLHDRPSALRAFERYVELNGESKEAVNVRAWINALKNR